MTTDQIHHELKKAISQLNVVAQHLRDTNEQEQIIMNQLQGLPPEALNTVIAILKRLPIDEEAMNTVRKLLL